MALTNELIRTAAELARDNPNRWEFFITQLRVYSTSADTALVAAPPTDVLAAQGFAKSVRVLLDGFTTAVSDHNRISQRR